MSKPPLLEEVREIIRLRHNSIRTEEAYGQTIRRFILFHHRLLRRSELSGAAVGVCRGEVEQPGALAGQGGSVLLGQSFEGGDDQSGGAMVSADPPSPVDEAVAEHGAKYSTVAPEDPPALLVGHDAGAVGVGTPAEHITRPGPATRACRLR